MSLLFPNRESPQDDDPFASTRMSFGDHIEDLRSHMLRAVYGLLVGLLVGFVVAEPVLQFIQAPVQAELMRVYANRMERAREKVTSGEGEIGEEAKKPVEMEMELHRDSLAKVLGKQPAADAPEWVSLRFRFPPFPIYDAQKRLDNIIYPPALKAFTVTESFIVWMKVAFYAGLVMSAPWIFVQLWSFIAAGLYPQEKRLVNRYLPLSIVLFFVGVCFCQFVVIPKAIEYLLAFSEWLGMEPELRLSDWLSFALMAPLLFGLAAQTPLVMYLLYRLGFVNKETFKAKRRIAWFGLAVAAVVLAASPDVFSYSVMTVSLWALYELGILFCWLWPRPEFAEETELEDMVEV
jgi:sec-independent protein translocase protein TatC